LFTHAHVAQAGQQVLWPAVACLLLWLLVLQILGLLGSDLVLKVANLLLVLCYLHCEGQKGLVAWGAWPLALLSNNVLLLVTLQLLYLLKQLVASQSFGGRLPVVSRCHDEIRNFERFHVQVLE
jgi:hypothetical protein